jgi:transcriptional regulator with XRE-family HTH domain
MSDLDPTRQPFRQWLGHRRRARGYTQVELAAKVGCSVFTIGRIEEGARRPSRKLAELLVDALGVPDDQRAGLVQLARERPGDLRLGDSQAGQDDPPPLLGDHREKPVQPVAWVAGPPVESEAGHAGPAVRVGLTPFKDLGLGIAVIMVAVSPESDARQVISTIAGALAGGGVDEHQTDLVVCILQCHKQEGEPMT